MSEVKFAPFQKVLGRDADKQTWKAQFFSHMSGEWYCCIGTYYRQCIPYEGNEHLLGTTDSPTPPESEFKWGDHVEAKLADGYIWEKAIYCFKENGKFVCLYPDSHLTIASYCRHAEW